MLPMERNEYYLYIKNQKCKFWYDWKDKSFHSFNPALGNMQNESLDELISLCNEEFNKQRIEKLGDIPKQHIINNKEKNVTAEFNIFIDNEEIKQKAVDDEEFLDLYFDMESSPNENLFTYSFHYPPSFVFRCFENNKFKIVPFFSQFQKIINALTKSPYTFFLQTTEKFGDKQMNDLDWNIVIAKLNKILENTNCYLLVS